MNKQDYFKSLVSLYEAVGMAGTQEVVPQEQIADTGMDVNGMVAQQPMPQQAVSMDQQLSPEEMPQDPGMEDAAYLQQPIDPNQQVETPSSAIEKQKSLKLFDLMDDLVSYGENFKESLDKVDVNLLDFEVLKEFKKYSLNVNELVEKIKSYAINIFSTEVYEKNLYNYILFRTELISIVKGLRNVLKLENLEDESILDAKKVKLKKTGDIASEN